MEDKRQNSFYEFLAANSDLTNKQPNTETKTKTKPQYLFLSWISIFLLNSLALWLSWNFVISTIIDLPSLSFVQSVALYTVTKTLFRGFFSVQ